MSMSDIAKLTTINGDETDFTYGAVPNDPNTWDHDMMYGCHCDEGYGGYDCSEKACPTGDDPYTGGFKEVQLVHCNATSGTFKLGFRTIHSLTAWSSPISYSSGASTVKATLEALPTIGNVDVEVIDTLDGVTTLTQVCHPYGRAIVKVTFLSELGDVPSLKAETTNLMHDDGASFNAGGPVSNVLLHPGHVTVYSDGASYNSNCTSVTGTTEDWECSGRGMCDLAIGVCTCFPGLESSDGTNNPGSRGDCGAVMAIPPV